MPATQHLTRRRRRCDDDINYVNYQPALNLNGRSLSLDPARNYTAKSYYYAGAQPNVPYNSIQQGHSNGPVMLNAWDDDDCYRGGGHDHRLTVGAIVGIVIGGLVLIIILFFVRRHFKKRGLQGGDQRPGVFQKLKDLVAKRKGVRGDEEKAEAANATVIPGYARGTY